MATISSTAEAHGYQGETIAVASTGPSFAAALCGFLCTTTATTMLLFLLGSY